MTQVPVAEFSQIFECHFDTRWVKFSFGKLKANILIVKSTLKIFQNFK